jgi:pimeloyl-ACP methyl ester carboxylesterase
MIAPPLFELHKEIYGAGDPIVCLHGLGGNVFTWRHFIKPFSETNQLVIIDFRGFGASPKPDDTNYSIQQHADDIYGMILRDNLQKLTLIGNSFGGGVALLVALRLCEEDPGRLSKLVLIDSGGHEEFLPAYLKFARSFLGGLMIYLPPGKAATWFVLRASYFDPKKITKEQINAYAAPIASPGGRHAFLQTAKQCIPANINEIIPHLKDITVPTLILWGRQDKVIPLTVGELLHQAIPNSTLEVLDQCGHIPQEEKPEETIASISKFLQTT